MEGKTKAKEVEGAAIWHSSYGTGVYTGTEAAYGSAALCILNKYRVNGKPNFFVRFYQVPT